MREVRIALLEADVNFKVVRQFIASVREKALGAEVLKSLTGPQQVIGIVNDELVEHPRRQPSTLQLASKPPTVIMLVGLKGSGKTTTAAKLALHLRKNGAEAAAGRRRPLSRGGRRAASGARRSQLNMPVFSGEEGQSLPDLCTASLKEAARQDATVVIVDTAGRSTIDGEMMERSHRHERRAQAERDDPRARRDDRPGSRQRRAGVPRPAQRHRHHRLEDGRRCARRRRALDPRGQRAAREVHRHRREVGRPRAVLPGPLRLAHPRHGRHARPHRDAPRTRSATTTSRRSKRR